jgi:exodeoxyribonuclease VII small subunit
MKAEGSRKQKSFEAALNRLEEIVSEMEAGELKLDLMLKKCEEGMQLAQFCSKKLETAQKKIEILKKKRDGSFETEEFPETREEADEADELKEEANPEEESAAEESEEEQDELF